MHQQERNPRNAVGIIKSGSAHLGERAVQNLSVLHFGSVRFGGQEYFCLLKIHNTAPSRSCLGEKPQSQLWAVSSGLLRLNCAERCGASRSPCRSCSLFRNGAEGARGLAAWLSSADSLTGSQGRRHPPLSRRSARQSSSAAIHRRCDQSCAAVRGVNRCASLQRFLAAPPPHGVLTGLAALRWQLRSGLALAACQPCRRKVLAA